MNKKIFLLAAVLSVAIIAGFVYAATLISTTQVQTCTDSDSGVNISVKGNTFGLLLNGNPYNYTDVCLGETTLFEYACSTVNATRNLEVWNQDCTQVNKTCSNGRCV